MKVKGLDGQVHQWQLSNYFKERNNASSYHTKAREVLRKEFPTQVILEEVPIPGLGRALFADFFIPHRKMMVEVQGQQHYEQIGHFHGTDLLGKLTFARAQKRDSRKKEWCELNGITLIELSYEEDVSVWRNKIRKG